MRRHLIFCSTLFVIVALSILAAGNTLPGRAQSSGGSTTVYLPLIFKSVPPTWIGPSGGSIVNVVADPKNASVLYAGSWGAGVFKSTDGGATWKSASAGLNNLFINALGIDPVNTNILYAGPYKDKIYKTIDGGQTWFRSDAGIQPMAVAYSIVVSPANHNEVFAATRGITTGTVEGGPWNGELYKSIDGGATWVRKLYNAGGFQQDWMYSIAISPKSPNVILAAGHITGPWLSTNDGETWWNDYSGVYDRSGRAMVIDPTTSGNSIIAYLGVWHRNGVFRTINGGASWYNPSTDLNTSMILKMDIDPLTPTTLYAGRMDDQGVYRGVMKTTNGGINWSPTGLASGVSTDSVYAVTVNPSTPATVYAGTTGDGFWLSNDRGANWSFSSAGILNSHTTSLVVLPPDGKVMYASSLGGGVARSTDGGATWANLNAGLTDKYLNQVAVDPTNSNVIYAAAVLTGWWKNDLSKATGWMKYGQATYTSALAPAASLQNALPGMEAIDNPFTGLPPTPDKLAAPTATSIANILKVLIKPVFPYDALAATYGEGVYFSGSMGCCWYSSGLYGQTVWDLVGNPANPNIVYAASDGAGKVQISNDFGKHWNSTNLPDPLNAYTLSMSAADTSTLYAGTNSGVYRLGADRIWRLAGLPGWKIQAILVHPARPNWIYVGTATGVFISPDGGVNWANGPVELNGKSITAITIDPSNPDLVYYSTDTQGILKVLYR